MIVASDIILKLIKEQGYNSYLKFCEKNGIDKVGRSKVLYDTKQKI